MRLAMLAAMAIVDLTLRDLPGQLQMGFTIGLAMAAGALLRDFAIARKSIKVWPFYLEYFDWPKIEETAEELGI